MTAPTVTPRLILSECLFPVAPVILAPQGVEMFPVLPAVLSLPVASFLIALAAGLLHRLRAEAGQASNLPEPLPVLVSSWTPPATNPVVNRCRTHPDLAGNLSPRTEAGVPLRAPPFPERSRLLGITASQRVLALTSVCGGSRRPISGLGPGEVLGRTS